MISLTGSRHFPGFGRAQVASCYALFCTLSCLSVIAAEPPAHADALRSFEAALVEVIERVEPSVVAISRAAAPPQNPATETQQRLGQRQLDPGGLVPQEGPAPWQELGQQFGAPDPFGNLRQFGGAEPRVTGAGVVIDPKGLILTQYLVVKPGETHFVTTSQGDRIPAEIVGADPRSGLAILRARSDKLKAVELGRAEDLKKGNLVVAIGNPYALESDGQATASYGMVSNLARKAPVGENLNETTKTEPTGQQGYATTLHHYGTLIQTDAKLGWNASGGALVTLDGKLVGLTTSVATIAGHEAPAGYAIPIDKTMRRVIDTLKEGREVEYGLLGIGFQPTAVSRLSDGAPGILVDSVYRGSAADRAGLRPGDIVAEIDGQPTANADRLQLLIGSLSPQDETHLVYERAGALEETSVRLDKIHVPGEKVVTTRPPGWQGIHIDFATAIETPLLNAASAPQGLIDSSGCVAVVDVDKDSLSWKQGVRPGMFISHVAGKRVSTPQEFRDAVREADGSVKLRFTPGNSPENAQPVAPLSE